jgi:hypothetical protein
VEEYRVYYKNLNFIYVLDSELKNSEKIEKVRKAFPEFPEISSPAKEVYILHDRTAALGISPSQIMCIFSGEETINTADIVEKLNKLSKLLNVKGPIRLGLKVEGFEKVDVSSRKLSLTAHKEEAEILEAVAIGYRFIINNAFVHGDIKIEPYLKDENQIYYDGLLQTIETIPFSETEKGFSDMFTLATEKAGKAAATLLGLKGAEREDQKLN